MNGQRVMADGRVPRGWPSLSGTNGISWIAYLAMCGAGLTMGLTWIGPRAAEGLGMLNAVAFWAAHVWPALVLLAVTQITLSRIRSVASLPGLAQVLLTATVASLLFTPVALVVDLLFDVEPSKEDEGDPLLLMALMEFAQFAVPIGLTWTLINAPSLLRVASGAFEPTRPDEMPVEVEAAPTHAEFWSRIPRRLGRDLVALSAELHYLRVYTTLGDTLILYPFGRAVDELEDMRGMQVHRSHWVALGHVVEVRNRDGRMYCHMADGPVLPVSRSYRGALKVALRTSA
jgi:hypothetical protein